MKNVKTKQIEKIALREETIFIRTKFREAAMKFADFRQGVSQERQQSTQRKEENLQERDSKVLGGRCVKAAQEAIL